MNINPRHAQLISDWAGMLPTRTAKTGQCVFGHIMAALYRDKFDRVCHIRHGNLQKTFGDLFGCFCHTGGMFNFICQRDKFFADNIVIQGLIGVHAE